MTLSQLETLSEEEMDMALFIVNNIFHPGIPKIEFEPRHLTWFKRSALIQKIIDSFPRIKPNYHGVYESLLKKLGIVIEIKATPPPVEPTAEISGSVSEIAAPLTEIAPTSGSL